MPAANAAVGAGLAGDPGVGIPEQSPVPTWRVAGKTGSYNEASRRKRRAQGVAPQDAVCSGIAEQGGRTHEASTPPAGPGTRGNRK